ncbi:MAG: penicillin-binding protein 2, penicillin-binding protein 2 [Patescibacteria group bacterium]|nr:penicillin-binding protein 2, penicillin-binding protein 2 [Patescibacteria group bacterium]
MDTLNVSGLDTQQFEGVIEKSIGKKVATWAGIIFIVVGILFVLQLGRLQIMNGKQYLARSETNRLHSTPTFADRGVIYDRNGKELAWNVVDQGADTADNKPDFSVRDYIELPGFAHLIGYVGYPTRDSSGFFWQNSIIGKSGIEKKLNAALSGTNGQKIIETDASQHVISENLVTPAKSGQNVTLTVDAGIQSALYSAIKNLAESKGFVGGAGAIMNIKTGEIIAITNYPEYDLNILSHGNDSATIAGYATDPRHVYLNRAVSGLFTPGSTVKPYEALGALNEGIITPSTTVLSTGGVEIPNPYDTTKSQIFHDWKKGGHGVVDVYKAIAESVNTFFYEIGGGYKSQQGLGISGIDKYAELFGLGQKTGIDIDGEVSGNVPSPAWKAKTFPKDGTWRLGDTYNSAIGQFGFQVTVVQMLRAVAGMATSGTLVTPYVTADPKPQVAASTQIQGIDSKWYSVLQTAMRQTVTNGTAVAINVPYVHAAAKTGTAQVGPNNSLENSWSTGFWPVENPQYAFVVVMDQAKSTNETGATYAVRDVFDWIEANEPQYFDVPK